MDFVEGDADPTVPAGAFPRGARKSLAGMDCPEKKGLSRNSGTVHRGVGVVPLDSLEEAESSSIVEWKQRGLTCRKPFVYPTARRDYRRHFPIC